MAAAPAQAGEQNPAYWPPSADLGARAVLAFRARDARGTLRSSDAPRPRRPARALSRSASPA